MGYRCPVCEDPHPDGEHLANHLAFTGMLGDEAHEAWLDETVPSWSEMDPESLGAAVTDAVPEVDLEDIETTEAQPPGRPEVDSDPRRTASQDVDPDTAAALEQAREMTREMLGADAEGAHSDADEQGDDSEGEDR